VEKHLTLALGRTLNAAQQDLISKVRGFTENAREAMRSGDWVRAKNLSKKAEVLSDQLAASL
jgi:exosome complex RNA-binding protein Csl4